MYKRQPLITTQTSFVNLTPSGVAQGTPLDISENDPVPGADAGMSAPPGWNFYNFPGAMCRDGSPLGIYVRRGSVNKLMIYLEGGGVCISTHFCDHNPANMNQVFPGGSLNGESFSGSLTTVSGLQAPYTTGIFDTTNSANPFLNWNQIYVPYCTGDAHIGTNASANIPNDFGIATTQHFVGALNMQLFVSRIVPTFKSVEQVVLTGSSAGGIGAGLNFGMVQDSFGNVPVTLVDDSFPPFTGTQDITPCCLLYTSCGSGQPGPSSSERGPRRSRRASTWRQRETRNTVPAAAPAVPAPDALGRAAQYLSVGRHWRGVVDQ